MEASKKVTQDNRLLHTYYFEEELLMVEHDVYEQLAPSYYSKRHGEWLQVNKPTWDNEYFQWLDMGFI